jgi:hypothetical protein
MVVGDVYCAQSSSVTVEKFKRKTETRIIKTPAAPSTSSRGKFHFSAGGVSVVELCNWCANKRENEER